MTTYPNSSMSLGSYDHHYNVSNLEKVYMFINPCVFLDSCYTDANISDDTIISTPDLAFSIPAPRHDQLIGNHQDIPWNSEDVPSNPRNQGCRSQWTLLRWFIQRTDANYRALQQYPNQDVPPDLQGWLTQYHLSKEVRKVGLRTLVDILQKNTLVTFGEILCAVIVQHAIFESTSKRNSFEQDIESAFSPWGNIGLLTQSQRDTLNSVLQRLTMSSKSSHEDNRLASMSDLSNTHVLETGSGFQDQGTYPLLIDENDNSLSDMPTFAPSDYNIAVPPLNSPLSTVFALGPRNYAGPNLFDSPHTPNSHVTWGAENSIFPPSSVNCSFQPELGTYSQQNDAGQLYVPNQSFGYIETEAQTGVSDLDQSAPFISFMRFLDGFMNLGNLHHHFSHGVDPIRRIDVLVTYNARTSQSEFLMDAERSLFSPIDTPQLSRDPLIQAIITTTRSLAALGRLHSIENMADYMIYLSKNVLASSKSCRNFAQAVLRICPRTPTRERHRRSTRLEAQCQDQDQGLKPHLDQIESEFRGECNPGHLLRPRTPRSGSGRPLQSEEHSQASHYQLTLSSAASSLYGQSYLDNTTEASSTYEPTTNTTPSVTSNAQRAQCEECGKTFGGKHISSHLSRHRRSHREADKYISCPICAKVFHHSRTDNIRNHCRTVHNYNLPENGKLFWASLQSPPQPGL